MSNPTQVQGNGEGREGVGGPMGDGKWSGHPLQVSRGDGESSSLSQTDADSDLVGDVCDTNEDR